MHISSAKLTTIVVIALALAACGEKSQNSANSSDKAAAPVKDAKSDSSRYMPPTVARANLEPMEKYNAIELDRTANGDREIAQVNAQFMQAYWSAAELKYDTLAYDLLKDYRLEKDTFKRKDIVNANKEMLDSAHQEFKGKTLFAITVNDGAVTVSKYDSEAKGFEVRLIRDEDRYTTWQKPNEGKERPDPAWGLRLIGGNLSSNYNAPKIYYRPQNEEEARRIESMLSSMRRNNETVISVASTYLGRAVAGIEAPDFNQTNLALVVIDGVAIKNPKSGETVFTLSKEELGKDAFVTCRSSVEALKLKMPESLPMNVDGSGGGGSSVKTC